MSARQDGGDRDPGRPGPARPAVLAFFDVDETLVADKTIFSFLEHHYAAAGREPGDYTRVRAHLRRQAEQGVPREEVNRAYYRLFAGSTAAELEKSGAAWFANRLTGGFFHPPVLEALRAHAAAGDTVVLVSGSFFACLDPIARFVGATDVVGTALLAAGGRLTGEIERPMIGQAKADAAAALAAARGMALADCHAYGDHVSDLPLLRAVGHPVAVGDDATLGRYAERAGGRRLPGIAPGRVV